MDDVELAGDVLEQAVVAALRAPSIFNTQPWRWVVDNATASLFASRSRQLEAVDPDGRLMMVSCGAALHHALVVLAAAGQVTEVSRLPEQNRPDLLARVRLHGAVDPDPGAVTCLRAIHDRHTDRRPFGTTPVADSVLRELVRAAERHGAHLLLLDSEQVGGLAAVAVRAAATQLNDPAYRAELDRWTHRPASSGDGVPVGNAEPVAARRVPVRRFHLEEVAPPGRGLHPADESARYAVLFTDADAPIDWLVAGEALSDVLLTATVAGAAVSPMSDVTETPVARNVLRLLGTGDGHPVLALRIGVPESGPLCGTPRRRMDDVVVLEGGGLADR